MLYSHGRIGDEGEEGFT